MCDFFYSCSGYVTEFTFEEQTFMEDGVTGNLETTENLETTKNKISSEERLREIVLETIENMKESAN